MSSSRSRMFGDEPPVPEEVPSPRTTIVGGRPPDPEAELPPVPTGLQQLLRLATVDDEFRRRLLESRGAIAEAAGVQLTASERAILQAVPSGQLSTMIQSLPAVPADRRSFLREAAAGAVTALGGAALVPLGGCADRLMAAGGARPDFPPDQGPRRPQHNETQSEGGISPHGQAPARAEERGAATGGGAAPDQPPEREQHRMSAPGGAAPDVPGPPGISRGIRPDVPPVPAGVRPDVPPPKPKPAKPDAGPPRKS